ncbi:REF/SRPP-like protein [Tanacetum coccineum]
MLILQKQFLVACGINARPKDPMVNINASDINNELAETRFNLLLVLLFPPKSHMADTDVPVTTQPEIESEQERLKYLEFVQVALLHALLYASKVYCYAKENSGPLKPGVETIEGTLKTVVGPAYDKFHDVPVEVLKFVDRKASKTRLMARYYTGNEYERATTEKANEDHG